MRYPTVGEEVRVKNETGLHTIVRLWKPGRVLLDDGRIFYLGGIVTHHQKTILTFVIQQHYGSGWEDVTQEETITEAIQRRKEYRENTNYPTRLIRRKEPNTLYQK
jgi:hypothetical protein